MIKLVNRTETQIEVSVPFEIKDIFKNAIKAKYNASTKTWTCDNTQENKDKLNEINRTLKEVEVDTKNDLETLKAELAAMKAELEEMKAIKEALNAIKKDIQEVAEEVVVGFETLTAEYVYKDMSVAQVIAKCKTIAQKYDKQPKSNLKSEFYALQSFLSDIYDKVKERYGLELKTLVRVSQVNLNRLDRDMDVFNENIFIVKKSD